MAGGQDEPADRDDGRVLAPDELDLSDDEHVAELEEGRYVVSPNDPINESSAGSTASNASSNPGSRSTGRPDEQHAHSNRQPEPPNPEQSEPAGQTEAQPLDQQRVHEWMETELDGVNSRYGFDVTAKFDGSVQQRQMMSNDVVTIFESLVLWCAQNIDRETPVEEVLGILLMESNVPIRYPPESLKRAVQSQGLGPDDSIADLMDAIEDDGLKF